MGIESLRMKNVELQQKIYMEDPVPIVVLFCSVVKKGVSFPSFCRLRDRERGSTFFSHSCLHYNGTMIVV